MGVSDALSTPQMVLVHSSQGRQGSQSKPIMDIGTNKISEFFHKDVVDPWVRIYIYVYIHTCTCVYTKKQICTQIHLYRIFYTYMNTFTGVYQHGGLAISSGETCSLGAAGRDSAENWGAQQVHLPRALGGFEKIVPPQSSYNKYIGSKYR